MLTIVALVVAFVSATALERHRQGRRPRTLTLRQTPSAWQANLVAIGALPTAVAACIVLVALALLLAPRLPRSGGDRPARTARAAGAEHRAAGVPPAIEIVRVRIGRRFRAGGAEFTVRLQGARGTGAARRHRQADVALEVIARNLRLRHFDPTDLSYRLESAAGEIVYPAGQSGTGPDSLGRTGALAPGQTGRTDLLFRIPGGARRSLALVFEANPDGSPQVRVPIASAT